MQFVCVLHKISEIQQIHIFIHVYLVTGSLYREFFSHLISIGTCCRVLTTDQTTANYKGKNTERERLNIFTGKCLNFSGQKKNPIIVFITVLEADRRTWRRHNSFGSRWTTRIYSPMLYISRFPNICVKLYQKTLRGKDVIQNWWWIVAESWRLMTQRMTFFMFSSRVLVEMLPSFTPYVTIQNCFRAPDIHILVLHHQILFNFF